MLIHIRSKSLSDQIKDIREYAIKVIKDAYYIEERLNEIINDIERQNKS